MSEMIERVARAMWELRRKTAKAIDIDLEEWGDGSIPRLNHVLEEAHAAIEAMREPTSQMKSAFCASGAGDIDAVDINCAWSAMIDAALK